MYGLSPLRHPKLCLSLPTPRQLPTSPTRLLNISSVRNIEEKSETTTTTISQNSSNKQNLITQKPTLKKVVPTLQSRRVEPSFPANIINALYNIINNIIDPPLRPSLNPRNVLSDNFAPVDELPPMECDVVQGCLPSCLDGAYIRNGPNPQFLPHGPYHFFDGDGMLHSIRISNGQATLCSRYVKTYKYKVENDVGSPVIPNVLSGFNGLTASVVRGAITAFRVLTGQFNPCNGIGLANTSLALIAGTLYALCEYDLPYAVKLGPEGDIITLGRHDFNGDLFMNMTAHPKIDPDTGETFAFRYSPIPPFLTYFRFNAEGEKQPDVPIFSSRPSYVHDFTITKRYAIFADTQIGMNPVDMIVRGGSPMGANLAKVSRVGVIPRYAKDETEMKWFDVPGFNNLHVINAWDEERGDAVVMVAPNILSVEHTFERMDLVHASLEKLRLDFKTGMVSRFPMSARNLEFAVINPAYVGKKGRYVNAAIGDPMPKISGAFLKISGLVKLDILISEEDRRDCTVASRIYGLGCYGSEPFFVARQPN